MKLNDYYAVAAIEFYDEIQNTTIKENQIITNVSSYAETVALLEEYYGNTIETIQLITLFEGPFLRASDSTIEKIVMEEI